MELQRKLNQPWVSGCGNTSEVDITNVSIRITEASVIENVEELRSEFNDLVFTDPRSLHHREVKDDVAGAVENVATETAEAACPCIDGIRLALCIQSTVCGAKVHR